MYVNRIQRAKFLLQVLGLELKRVPIFLLYAEGVFEKITRALQKQITIAAIKSLYSGT